MNCTAPQLYNHLGYALSAEGATIKGTVFLDEGFQAKGGVRLPGADIGGTLTCSGGLFQNPEGYAIAARHLNVRDEIILQGMVIDGRLDLTHASIGYLIDDQQSWPAEGHLSIEGFEYTAITGDAPATADKRLEWLRRQPRETFVPQTYDQLATVFRRMGREADAIRVMIAKQEDLISFGRLTPWGWFGKQVLGWTVGHGYRSWLALVWMAVFFLIGSTLFWQAELAGLMLASETQPPTFYAWLYSLDTLLPIVNLQQEDSWAPIPVGILGLSAFLYLRLQIVVGWFLTTLFVAGVAGIVRRIEYWGS
jgi:hypothetical protein